MAEVRPIQEFEQVVDEILLVNGYDEAQRHLPSELNSNWLFHLKSPLVARVARFGNIAVTRGYFGEKDEPRVGRMLELDDRIKVFAAEGESTMYRTTIHQIEGLAYRMARDLRGSVRTTRILDGDEQLATVAWLKAPFLVPDLKKIVGKLNDEESRALFTSTENAQKLDRDFDAISNRDHRRSGYEALEEEVVALGQNRRPRGVVPGLGQRVVRPRRTNF